MTNYSPFNEGSVEGDSGADKLRNGFINLETQLASIQNVNAAGTPLVATPNLVWCTGNGSDTEASFRTLVSGDIPTTLSGKTLSGTTTLSSNTFDGDIVVTNNTNSLYALPTLFHDVDIEYTSASEITIKAGSKVRSADDSADIVFGSDYVVDISNTTPDYLSGGRVGSETSSTYYFLYFGLDSSNRPIAWLDINSDANGDTVVNPASYSTGIRQIRFSLFNNGSSDIFPFLYHSNSEIQLEFSLNINKILDGGSATSYTTLDTTIPKISRLALLATLGDHTTTSSDLRWARIRTAGTSGDGIQCHYANSNANLTTVAGIGWSGYLYTDANQDIEYICSSSVISLYVYTQGYKVTEVK